MELDKQTNTSKIIALHDRILQVSGAAIGWAIECGQLIREQRKILGRGEFLPWIEECLPFDKRTAYSYMKYYDKRHLLNCENASQLTLSGMSSIIKKQENSAKIKESEMAASIDEGIINNLNDIKGRKFSCIYADPPWKYGNQGTRASTNNHYSTMTVDEICRMPIGDMAKDRAHLHLWTTNGFLFECPKIFDAWGFEFKSSFIWCKPQMGIGNYWRNSHEFLLLAVRGRLTAKDKSCMSWIEHDRGKHSSKPERIRDLIERVSPGPYLELFGRHPQPGWMVYGNQMDML